MAEPILSAESARSLGQAMATIVMITRFSTNITDTVRAPFSSYTSDDQDRGTDISYSQPLFVVVLSCRRLRSMKALLFVW